ncbi:phage baseplate assembly protein [Rhizobium tumorigenes]|uniref:phage baseplate assembly protein n=1 Tax=Rhizobium tumorigenes TaxID=2041385 RepID=UPI00241E30C2|nr:hypothetical protein [Rhizobium tumorigenes]WFS01586.1 hypothetical protein PR016_02830 [Rhizobium tumorigenes]
MFEDVTIEGLPPYKSLTLRISAEEAVRSATAQLAVTGSGVGVVVGQKTKIKSGKDLLLTGYVRTINPSHDEENRSLSVTIVSRTVDATECSVDHPTGEVLNKSLADIGREFDAGGIGIEDDGTLPIEPRHKLHTGESLFETLEKRGRGRGILIHDTPKGKLKIATKPEGTHSGRLAWGINIKKASSSLGEKGRFSKVKVRGQNTEGTGKQQLRAEAAASDRSVRRHRTIIVRHEGETTTDRMKKRAEWHVKRGAGNATTASITTFGWRDQAGKIWTPNWLVPVYDDWIGIDGMMIIKSVTLTSDASSEGTTAVLELADPRALGGENPRGKTAEAYNAPDPSSVDYEEQ